MRILVYHAGALGDFVTILPLLAALRKANFDDAIVLACPPSHAPLGVMVARIDHTWDAGGRRVASLFAGGTPGAQAADEAFDRAYLFAQSDSPLIANLRLRGTTDIRHQPPFPDGPIHIADYHLQLIDKRYHSNPYPLVAPARARIDGNAFGGSRAAILHPGSGSPRKNWPITRFVELAKRLEGDSLTVHWATGPVEEGLGLPADANRIAGRALDELAVLLAGAALFVGNDSGVSHLAAACGCPAAILFGPSDPAVWAPRGRHVRIVDATPPCRPCHPWSQARAECLGGCMDGLTVEEVHSVCTDLLASAGNGQIHDLL